VARGDAAGATTHFEAAAELHERRQVPLLLAESMLDWADAIDRNQARGPGSEKLRRRSAEALADRGAELLNSRIGLVTR
jgi:hypothetical protein